MVETFKSMGSLQIKPNENRAENRQRMIEQRATIISQPAPIIHQESFRNKSYKLYQVGYNHSEKPCNYFSQK